MLGLRTLALALLFITFTCASENFYDGNGGQYLAIINSGDVDDFGFNYIVNQGRVSMEYKLNMSNTLFIPNIPDNVTAIPVAISLVQRNYRVIISTTNTHGNAMSVVAAMYPNVTFIQYAIKSTLPNLSYISWSNAEYWFIIGVFCGATTINNKVGFVHPGPVVGTINSINGFYSGVKYANPNLDVYTMFTGEYIDVDRATGATNYLLNKIGVGSLTGHQDDLTVPRAAMAAGLLAVGITGYSLRQLYGELVGVSTIRDWTTPLATVSAGVTGAIYKGDISGTFKSNGQYLDTPSHLVSAAQWKVVADALAIIKTGKTQYYCGSYLGLWNLNDTTGCLPNSTQFNTQIYPGVFNEGFYTVPLTDFKFPRTSLIGIIVATAILLVLPVAIAIGVIILRNDTKIKTGSPFFFLVFIAGSILVYAGVIVWPIDPSVNACYARVWLPSLGATIGISALITKNIRIFLLFFNPFKFSAEVLSIRNFFPIVVVFVALDAMLLIIYSALGPKGVHVQQGTDGLGKYETRHVCATSDTGNSIIYAILAFHMLQLVIGCVISFKLRNVTAKEFNERKAVAMAIYVITFCLIIVAILVGVTDVDNNQTVVFISVSLLICNTAVLLIVFGSRFLDVFIPEDEHGSPHMSKENSKKSFSSSLGTDKGGTPSSDNDSDSASARPTKKRAATVTSSV